MADTAIWWIRRDLRLTDNQALTAALRYTENVIPLFILDPKLVSSSYSGENRLRFLYDHLSQLHADLLGLGSRLVVQQGAPLSVLRNVMNVTGAHKVFAEKDFTPYARSRDELVAKHIPLTLTGGVCVFPPGTVLKRDGTPYTVFTPFSRAWKMQPLPDEDEILPAPKTLRCPTEMRSERLPVGLGKPAGEKIALHRLHKFVKGSSAHIYNYAQGRDRMDLSGTSELSPFLRFGVISCRQVVKYALEAIKEAPGVHGRQGAETWLNELIWREFYVHILHHFPQVRGSSFRPEYDNIKWDNDDKAFSAWCEGRTGYPVVDAGMRQLLATGWMHNRARMIVASFLVKDLLIDWRWGERFFMQHLLDGDPAANNGGWQWTAGTGTDAAPYFRIFNPVLQGKKYDPEGQYIQQWVPVLKGVPRRYIHTPWEMPIDVQKDVNCGIGKQYPAPIINHTEARKRTLEAYAKAKAHD